MNSAELKLGRAREHLESFKQESDSWIKTDPYRIIDEEDPNPFRDHPAAYLIVYRRLRLESIDHVPERLKLVVGDILSNARAALDHLAFSLAKAHTPAMTDAQAQGSEFPIFGADMMSPGTEKKKIGCISPVAQAIIKGLQPYNRHGLYAMHPLWWLHDLRRVDFHRDLTVCTAVNVFRNEHGQESRAVGFRCHESLNIKCLMYCIVPEGELIPNAILAQYAVIPADPNREVYMDGRLPLEIRFADAAPTPLKPVIPTLQSILDFISNPIMAQLTKFL